MGFDIKETGNSDKPEYSVDANATVTVGNAQLIGTFTSNDAGDEIDFTWQESDGGSLTLADFFDLIILGI